MKKLILMIVLAVSLPMNVMAGNVKPTNTTSIFAWLNKNLNYPLAAIEKKEEGIVYISFSISDSGVAENVMVKAGVSKALNNEALKTVKNMPLLSLYNAAEPNKEYILPIRFSIK